MASVRLDARLEARLREAARITGKSQSAIIREAVLEHCDRLIGQRLDCRLADVIGSVNSQAANSRRTGEAFKDLLEERDGARRRK